nr:zinc finger CCCH domain-containing protein 43-like [Coffea arabica]
MINPVSETNFYAPYQQQMPIDEYPQGLGQPDCCYFLKTGDYKYKRNCRFNHPKLQSSKSTSCALSNKALPLRPLCDRRRMNNNYWFSVVSFKSCSFTSGASTNDRKLLFLVKLKYVFIRVMEVQAFCKDGITGHVNFRTVHRASAR